MKLYPFTMAAASARAVSTRMRIAPSHGVSFGDCRGISAFMVRTVVSLCVCTGIAWHAVPSAAVTYWDTEATDNSWATETNWTNGFPSSSNAAVFSKSTFLTTEIDGDKNAYGVSFLDLGAGIDNFTVNTGSGGGALRLPRWRQRQRWGSEVQLRGSTSNDRLHHQ